MKHFSNSDQSASQCIITPVTGYRINSSLTEHFVHSLRSILASRHFTGPHMPTQPQFSLESYRVPIYTPGSWAGVWIKCLADRQKYRAMVEFETGPRVERPLHFIMVSGLLNLALICKIIKLFPIITGSFLDIILWWNSITKSNRER